MRLDCVLTSVVMKLMSATTERFAHDRDVGPYSCVEGNPLQWRSAEVSCYRPVLGLVLEGRGRGLVLAFSALPDVEHLRLDWDEVEEILTVLGCGTFCTIGKRYRFTTARHGEALELLEKLLSDALSLHLRLWQGSAVLAHLRQAAWALCCLRGSCRRWSGRLGAVGMVDRRMSRLYRVLQHVQLDMSINTVNGGEGRLGL